MAHIHLDQCCPGLADPPYPGRTGPSLAVDWHMGHALPARPLPGIRGESDHRAANPTTLFKTTLILTCMTNDWRGGSEERQT